MTRIDKYIEARIAGAADEQPRRASAAEKGAHFVWDTQRARIVDADAAAVAFFGETGLIDLIERPFAPAGALAVSLAGLAASTGESAENGGQASGSIAHPATGGAVEVTARPTALADGRIGLAVAITAPGAAPPAPGSARAAALATALALPAGLFDSDGTWLAGNEAARELLGDGPHALGRLLGGSAPARRLIGAALADGLASATFRLATRFGARLARVTLARARDPETGGAAVAATFTDIADRARALGANRAGAMPRHGSSTAAEARALLSRVGHELRTPLTAIIGFADIMADERFGPIGNPKYAEYARDIRAGGGHLLGLVDDLLEIARSENGRRSLAFEAVDVGLAARQVVDLLREEANMRNIALSAIVPSDLPPVVADARTLRQILINLAGNAIKFTAAGGKVSLAVDKTADGGLAVEVADTGIGMSRAELAAALEPFGQVETAQSGRARGLGLGLPLARTLAESNKASFAIDSRPGQGTRVRVVFPPSSVLTG